MAQQIFAYILHKDGVIDDTALELITAAAKLNPEASLAAVVAGSGAELDAVCNEAAASYPEVWKIDNQALAYVNAEVLRGLLVRILPGDGIVLISRMPLTLKVSKMVSLKQFARSTADRSAPTLPVIFPKVLSSAFDREYLRRMRVKAQAVRWLTKPPTPWKGTFRALPAAT